MAEALRRHITLHEIGMAVYPDSYRPDECARHRFQKWVSANIKEAYEIGVADLKGETTTPPGRIPIVVARKIWPSAFP